MKTRTSILTILVAAVSTALALPLSAAPKTDCALVHQVTYVNRLGNSVVTQGTTKFEVITSLGSPQLRLNADTWVYPGFRGVATESQDDNCNTLLITFTDGRVSDLKLANDRAVAVIAKQTEPKKNSNLVAAATSAK